jgi:hypothetical protein
MVKKIESISQEQVKRLAKKIFIKRKAIEIAWAIIGILIITIIPSIIGYFILGEESGFCGLFFSPRNRPNPVFNETGDSPQYPCEGNVFGRWFIGFSCLLISGCIIYVISLLIYSLIKGNWEKSMEEAAECLLKQLKQ